MGMHQKAYVGFSQCSRRAVPLKNFFDDSGVEGVCHRYHQTRGQDEFDGSTSAAKKKVTQSQNEDPPGIPEVCHIRHDEIKNRISQSAIKEEEDFVIPLDQQFKKGGQHFQMLAVPQFFAKAKV